MARAARRLAAGACVVLAGATAATAAPLRVYTVAGGGRRAPANGRMATDVRFRGVHDVAYEPAGRILIAAGTRVFEVGRNARVRVLAHGGNVNALAADPRGGFVFVQDGPFPLRRVSAAGVESTYPGFSPGSADSAAVAPNGIVYVASSSDSRVYAVAPDAASTVAAGTGEQGFGGDGGPATSAHLSGPADVSLTAGGGFLVADSGNNRVRRVAPDGSIATVAGNGGAGTPRAGGLATQIKLRDPGEVAGMPSGGFLFVSDDEERIFRAVPGGTVSPFAGAAPYDAVFVDGGAANAAPLHKLWTISSTGDGGALAVTGDTIRYVAPPVGQVLAVAARAGRGSASTTSVRLPFIATQRVTARVQVMRGRSVLASGVSHVAARQGNVDVHGRVAPGPYRLELTARRGAARATARTVRFLGGVLPDRWAVHVADGDRHTHFARAAESVDMTSYRTRICHRFSATRADCEIEQTDDRGVGPYSCGYIEAVWLSRAGELFYRDYRCSHGSGSLFRRHPRRWMGAAERVRLRAP